MSDSVDGFARAKPRKISIAETYHYKAKAEVQDTINFRFEKANGEIKIEFVYDGERQDPRWALYEFLSSFLEKSKIFKQLKKLIHGFFQLKLLRWIITLWQWLIKKLLGKWYHTKYFGVAAMSDVAKHNRRHQSARVGHLALRNYKKEVFEEDWPEHQTLPIDISLDNLKQKLSHSEQCVHSYKYKLSEPRALPVHLRDIQLTDIEWDEFEQLHSDYDEVFNLIVSFEVDVGQPILNEDGRLPRGMVERWWKEQQKGKPKQDKDTQPIQRQIWLIDELADLGHVARRLATEQGGYILIGGTKINADEQNSRKLKKHLLQVAFQPGEVFVPVFEPYSYTIESKEVFVIPIPIVPPRWYEDRPVRRNNSYSNRLWVSSPETKVSHYTININSENLDRVREELAKTMMALANADGGTIFLKNPDSKQKVVERDFLELLQAALWYCWPPLNGQIVRWSRSRKNYGWTVEITQPSNEVHQVDGIVHKWEDDQTRQLSLSKDEDIDELYAYIEERCRLSKPTIETLPQIASAYLKGPHFEARKQNGVHYDPRQKILKWTTKIPFRQETTEPVYYADIHFRLNRPVELYSQDELNGEVDILFRGKILSGLDVNYFNALGIDTKERGLTLEKESKVKIIFDHIALWQVFRRRGFQAVRELSFEGVKSDYNRVKDIQGMLADIGLDNIDVRLSNFPRNRYFLEDIPVDDVMKYGGYLITASRPDGLQISLEVRGESANVNRERKEGERIDRMRVQSGRTQITLFGEVEGEYSQAQDLSRLLNRLQHLLKERFSQVRVQIA